MHVQGHEGSGGAGEKKTTFHSEFTTGTSVRARPTLANSTLARSNNCNYDYNYNHNLNKNIIYNKNYIMLIIGGNPKGGRKMRARRVGARRMGARRVGGQNFVLFFPLPPQCSFLLPSLWGRRGFTRQPENSKRAHFRVLAFKNTTKIQREDPQEREEGMKIVAGEGKKERNFVRSGGGRSGGGRPGGGRSGRGRSGGGRSGPHPDGPQPQKRNNYNYNHNTKNCNINYNYETGQSRIGQSGTGQK